MKKTFIFLLILNTVILSQWENITINTSKVLNSILFTSRDIGYVVGESGTIFKTSDAGASWTKQTSGTSNDLQSVFFTNNNKGWTVGYYGTVLETTDGGNSWSKISFPTNIHFTQILFVNNNVGYISGSKTYKTIDGGNTWTNTNKSTGAISFVSINNGFTCSGTSFGKTTDGGFNWSNNTITSRSGLDEIQFLDDNTGYIAGYHQCFKSIDGGNVWSRIEPSDIDFQALFFLDKNNGFVGGYGGAVYKTTDGGSSWSGQSAMGGYVRSLYFLDKNTGYAAGGGGLVSRYRNREITVEEPSGNENWLVGSNHVIKWTSDYVDYINIDYSTNNGINWISIVEHYSSNNREYFWTIPNTPTNNCKIRISDSNSDAFDISNNTFIITADLKIVYPNGGEEWISGSSQTVIWERKSAAKINIELSVNNEATWTIIVTNTDASIGRFELEVPNQISNNCKIRITDSNNSQNYDISDEKFTILAPPSLSIIKPNGGEQFDIGTIMSIMYSATSIYSVKIEYSTNNGSDWTLITASTPATGYYSFEIPDTPSKQCLIKVTDNNNQDIYDISDSNFEFLSVSWVLLNSGIFTNLQSVFFTNDNIGYACGVKGKILTTIDGGDNWNILDIGISDNLYSTFFVTSEMGWAVGSNGIILKTTNSGQSWTFQMSGTELTLRSVFFSDTNNGCIVGQDGIILTTTNSGNEWSQQQSNVSSTLNDVCFNSINHGWAVGNNGIYIRTTDGGNIWQRQTMGTSKNLYSVFFSDDSHGCIAGSNSEVFVSTDGGNVWNNGVINSSSTIYSLYFPSQLIGFLSSSSGNIFKTINGGNNWFKLGSAVNKNLYSIYFENDRLGYIVGEDGVVLKTTDGGITFVKNNKSLGISKGYYLTANYPNPFNPTTTISYQIPKDGFVNLVVYNTLGQVVSILVNEHKKSSKYSVQFNASNLPSGVYFYKIESGSFTKANKMLLVR